LGVLLLLNIQRLLLLAGVEASESIDGHPPMPQLPTTALADAHPQMNHEAEN
jgi:hypothetical protein